MPPIAIASDGSRYSARPAARNPDNGQRRIAYATTPNSSSGMPKPSIGCHGNAWPKAPAMPNAAAASNSRTPSHSSTCGLA